MTLISINSPNWLALPQPTIINRELALNYFKPLIPNQTETLVMLAINKTTAAKLIVLWNLPALLLIAGGYVVGTNLLT